MSNQKLPKTIRSAHINSETRKAETTVSAFLVFEKPKMNTEERTAYGGERL